MVGTPQYRRWCFTVNNYTEAECEAIKITLAEPRFEYAIVAKEIGDAGTPHLQGFFNTTKNGKLSLKACKKLLGLQRAHFEPAKGTSQQNEKYCEKGDLIEGDAIPPEFDLTCVDYKGKKYTGSPDLLLKFGVCPDPPGVAGGKKIAENYAQARAAAETGDVDSIEDPSIYVRCYNSLKRIAADHQAMPDDLEENMNVYIYGPPNTGKSYWARRMFPNCSVYTKDPHTKWFDGYDGEDVVVMDDLDCIDRIMFSNLKRWADLYPIKAEVKCGYTFIRPKHFIITSNRSLSENLSQLPLGPADVDAVRRRFREIFIGERTDANPNPFMHGPANAPADAPVV